MFPVDKFKIKEIKEEDDYASYQIGPLPKGYGHTMGSALRRILLSSIEGAAVTSVKVAGVKHEYSTIQGVIDDVLTILLKIKKLALRCHSDEPQTINLKGCGKGKIKAKDIKLTSEVEILNPDLEITELTDSKAKLEISMQVEKGVGYLLSDETKRGQMGVIPLDANFSPVIRVVFNISKTRVEQQTDLDQVDLEIYMNGAKKPREALEQAVEIYHKITERLVSVISGEQEEKVKSKKKPKAKAATSTDLDIDKLNLSTRLTNSLIKAGFKNLTDLEGRTVEEIMEIRGLGQRSAEELIEIMKSYKLKVKD